MRCILGALNCVQTVIEDRGGKRPRHVIYTIK
jgi:hypothetical protein